MGYIRFIAANRRFLSFGVLVMFFSCFGQTYFVALLGSELRGQFGLSHSDLGLFYSLGTMASGVSLLWLGRIIDRVDLRYFAVAAIVGLSAASAVLAVAQAAIVVPLAFYLLRLFGQGLMPHVATTAMARYFGAARGKALSIATLGAPASDALMPSLMVALIAVVGWRQSLWLCSAALVLVVVPLALVTLRGQSQRHAIYGRATAAPVAGSVGWTRAQMLRDWHFWVIAPAMLTPSFVLGGFFFHQAPLAQEKGWEMSWLAITFVGYALGVVVSSFASGPLIDRFGALRLVAWKLPPVMLGVVALAAMDVPLAALGFMVAAGIGAGLGYTMTGAVFAELYGTLHFGAIRSVVIAMQAAISAGSPYLFGVLIDGGSTMRTLAWVSAILLAIATLALWAALRHHPARR